MVDYIKLFRQLFLSPEDFFKQIKKEKGFLKPLLAFGVPMIIIYVISALLSIFFILKQGSNATFQIIIQIFMLCILSLAIITSPFINSLLNYLGLYIFGLRKGDFSENYGQIFKASCYSSLAVLPYTIVFIVIQHIYMFISQNPGANSMAFQPGIAPNPAIMIMYISFFILATLIQTIHKYYSECTGLSTFFKISKWRAFFSLIIVPIGLMVLFMLFLLCFLALIGIMLYSGALN